MHVLNVSGMTCGGCANSVTRAVHGVDKDAKVEVDLAKKTVTVDSKLPKLDIIDAITNVGFEARSMSAQH